MLWLFRHAKQIGETLKVWAEFIAYGSAGVFLIYKVVSGYFITDLSLKILCERLTGGQTTEFLAVTAVLKKGEKGTIRIHDVRLRVIDMASHVLDEKQMMGIERLSFKTDTSGDMQIVFNRVADKKWLSLPPGDETQFAALCNVPKAPCVVEVVVLGRKLWGGRSAQWRASAVSFPA